MREGCFALLGVRWAETLEPEHSLGDAKEMVDKFEARLSVKREVRSGRREEGTGFEPGQARGGRSQCFGWPTAEEAARSIPEATVMKKGDNIASVS
jgi:hypothetical protein